MKKIIFITLLLLGTKSFAQGNLQFNQVKLVSTVETVPVGKVWKVESATFSGGSIYCIGGSPGGATAYCGQSILQNYGIVGVMSFNINGLANHISNLINNSGMSTQLTPFPIWLPAGTTLSAGSNMRYLSVIEFNIIP